MDRISYAESQHDIQRVAELAVMGAAHFDGPFRGWAYLMYEYATSDCRCVVASPTDENPYHGDIVLPRSVIRDKGAREHHAYDLAGACAWRDAPARDDGQVQQTVD